MAFTPCAVDGRKYAGGASTFFLRLVRATESIGGKIQMCPTHTIDTAAKLAQRFQKVSEGDVFFDYAEPHTCANCGGDVAEFEYTFYGNAYPRGSRETQWYGKVCAQCRDAVIDDFSLDMARL